MPLLVFLTGLCGLAPFAIYAVQRATGALPDERTWWITSGSNHGPWRWQLEGLLLLYPTMVVALMTAVFVLWNLVGRRAAVRARQGGALLLVQVGMLWLQLRLLGWTID